MSKIAIDVVLLPSESMTEKAIEVNQKLLQRYSDKIILNKINCFPHTSLCMGVIDENDIPIISKLLSEIGKQFSALNLTATDLSSHTIPTGDKVAGFRIQTTEKLQLLHELIMKKLSQFLTYDVSTDMLFTPPAIEEVTFHWIKNYHNKSSFDKYRPHITLGFGEITDIKLPIQFTSSKLALCQLGNYCTCRKILVFTELQN
jgi:2'-5' RNA ligase